MSKSCINTGDIFYGNRISLWRLYNCEFLLSFLAHEILNNIDLSVDPCKY
jgi:hypothetical protein